MSAFVRANVRVVAVLAVAIAAERAAFAAEPVQSGEVVNVFLDQAKLMRVPDGTTTLVVGNPLIADVAIQAGGTMVITGKGYGTTNLLALNRAGAVMMEHQIEVQGPKGPLVVVYRGVERETYSCTPDCGRRITLGDNQTYFGATLAQSGSLNAQAQGGGGAGAAPAGGQQR